MYPRLVQHPVIRPHRCALLANVGASNEPTGFFDFGTDLDLEHVYVSVTAFRMMAAHPQIGFVPAGANRMEVARLEERLKEAEARRDDAERRLAAAEKQIEAVETLKRGGFAAAKRPGRPKKEPVS